MITSLLIAIFLAPLAARLAGPIRRCALSIYAYSVQLNPDSKVSGKLAHLAMRSNSRLIKSSRVNSRPRLLPKNPEPYKTREAEPHVEKFLQVTKPRDHNTVVNCMISPERHLVVGTDKTMPLPQLIIFTLIGLAIDDGIIKSIHAPVGLYVPTMSEDPRTIGQCIKGENRHASGMNRDEGFRLAAEALHNALGKMSISEYFHQKLWYPLGAEEHARWLLDTKGIENPAVGFAAQTSDLAKLTALLFDKGRWQNQQLVPEAWISKINFFEPSAADGQRA